MHVRTELFPQFFQSFVEGTSIDLQAIEMINPRFFVVELLPFFKNLLLFPAMTPYLAVDGVKLVQQRQGRRHLEILSLGEYGVESNLEGRVLKL
jgi:hypothetical protein